MKKRVISLLLALCLVIGLIPFTAQAAEVVAEGTCGENLTWVLTEDGTLTISGEGEMEDYENSDEVPWYSYAKRISFVKIGNGVTSIGSYSLYHLYNMTTAVIPDGVTQIGQEAFSLCSSLESITLPTSVTYISEKAFFHCNSLTTISIPANVSYIGDGAFSVCGNLMKIEVVSENANYSSDESGVLFNKDKTELVQFPGGVSGDYVIDDNVTSIHKYAFYGDNLVSVFVPDSVVEIGGFTAFARYGFTEDLLIVYGNHNSYIEEFAKGWSSEFDFIPCCEREFSEHIEAGCENGYDVYVCPICESVEHRNEDNLGTGHNYVDDVCTKCGRNRLVDSGTCGENMTWKFTDDGVLTISGSGEMTSAPWSSYSQEITSVVFEGEITSICDQAFYKHENLVFVTLPDSLISFGVEAFGYCTSLSEIVIPEGVTSIGTGAFAGCSSLKEIIIPDSVTAIKGETFVGCTNLEKVTIPDKMTDIDGDAFDGTLWQDSQDGFLIVGDGVLIHHSYEDSPEYLENIDLVIPDGVKYISSNFFVHHEISGSTVTASIFDTITFPEGLLEIGTDSFYQFNGTTLVFPESLQKIGGWDDTARGYSVFQNSPNLTSVYFYGDAPQIQKGAFMMNTSGRSISQPPTLYYIEGKSGWTDSEAYDPETNTWNGYPIATFTPDFTDSTPTKNPFTDVSSSAYYYEPVLWAVENNITGGTSATTFSPNASCTRGQIVTFLWAAAGRPEPKTTSNPFTDVSGSAYYYKAVLWAVENGITSGTSATTFGPNNVCTRGQVVTFLWAANGRPEPETTTNAFSDVKSSDYYYKAVLWAVENGITSGIGNGKFGPGNTCTRGQIVTFLYKAFA